MKSPIYELSPGNLETLLETNQFVQADLYTYVLPGGNGTLRYTNADIDIGYGGNTWSSAAPYHVNLANRPTATWKTGLDVGSWQYSVSPRQTDPLTGAAFPDQLLGQPWLAAVQAGALDGATVTVDRAYFAAWALPGGGGDNILQEPSDGGANINTEGGDGVIMESTGTSWGLTGINPTGVLRIFVGTVAVVDILSSQVLITLNDLLWRLSLALPRNYFQPGCRHVLYDSGCTLNAASFAVNGTVTAGSTNQAINSACGNPPGSATFALGQIVMTSGQNNGFRRMVRSWNGTKFTLMAPFPFTINTGDAFTAYAGCDKQSATCTLFSNFVNFGGEPFIPAPEDAI